MSTMDFRSQVYSPIQNMALWLVAWLYNHVSYDDLLEALDELSGSQQSATGEPFIDLLARIRQYHQPFSQNTYTVPVSFALGGIGNPIGIAPSHPAYELVKQGTGALFFSGADLDYATLIPVETDGSTIWHWHESQGIAPAPSYLLPGQADKMLSDATRDAVKSIEQNTTAAKIHADSHALKASQPRLLVGSLNDFYEAPGIPPMTPVRSEKLIARANNVAAIVEALVSRIGDHSFDHILFPLGQHIRQARMSAVNYAFLEWART
ncbi:hypothetical protein [Corynebacterium sp. sy039]|uniref:hypothetical protein n=1 Tax=Corynebacterium sp. sy039 TaxID=2599641 RepID=UPI0011B673CE|nr:hypothetical protein [Corynebacterium sp. sy039]QDZ42628.1 hypothetical protein FQV43_05235 [Corynebacterium sp. sy039]